MKHSILSSTLATSMILALIGCAPVDHLVAADHIEAGGKGGTATHIPEVLGGAGGEGGISTHIPEVLGGAGGEGGEGVGGEGGEGVGGEGGEGGEGGTTTHIPEVLGGAGGAGGVYNPWTVPGRPPTCAALDTPKDSRVIDVTIRNERATPVYIGQNSGCSGPSLMLYDQQGRSLTTHTFCDCSTVMKQGDCPAVDCAPPTLRRVDPNMSVVIPFGLVEAVQVDLPSECRLDGTSATTCNQVRPLTSGRYKLAITGSTDWACADWAPSSCDCMKTDSCTVSDFPAAVRAGELLEPSVEFELATTNQLTLTFTEGLIGSNP
ncbi:MAG TPA: hypothetical protein VIV60_11020 [Polyangiaceae bacterium]